MIAYGSNSATPSPLAMVPAVSRELIGPDGGQVEGGMDAPAPGPGAAIDQALADLVSRVSALEAAEVGEIA